MGPKFLLALGIDNYVYSAQQHHADLRPCCAQRQIRPTPTTPRMARPNRHGGRIAVLTHQQTPSDNPLHFISKSLAQSFIDYFHDGRRAAVRIDQQTIRIQVPLTFRKLKGYLRPSGSREIPQLLPPRRMMLLLYYPVRDQTTYRDMVRCDT